MPNGEFYGEPLRAAVEDGSVPESRVDDMLLRRFREMFRFGLFDRVPMTSPIPVNEHALIAREIGAAGSVLLRNEGGILPVDATASVRIALLGPRADQAATGAPVVVAVPQPARCRGRRTAIPAVIESQSPTRSSLATVPNPTACSPTRTPVHRRVC